MSEQEKVMRNYFNKRIFAFITVFFILLATGCGEKDTQSGAGSSDYAQSGQNDLADPENKDYKTEPGAEVNAEELEAKKGKANGIDVSKWQGLIDWNAVKSAGIDFAIIRIGFRGENGKIYKDDCADYNIQQAHKAGVLVGVYFFSTAMTTAEAKEEAEWTVSAIEGYPISYPVVYDCEGFLNPESRVYGISSEQRTDNAVTFLEYVEAEGYEGMFYAAKSELENSAYWDTERIEKDFMVWVARYPDRPYPNTAAPDYSGKYSMWQYTDKGAVRGIKGNADMNVSYFTREEAEPKNSAARPDDAKAPDADGALYTEASDEVTAKIETNLRDAATTKSNVVAVLKNGEFVKRTGIGSNGWSKLSYNGKTVYAISSYLTDDKDYKPPVTEPSDGFTASSGQVTAKIETNLRAEPNTDSEIVATIRNGEFVTRTGINPNGWTRVTYNGRTAYAKTSLLTTEVNSSSSSSEEPSRIEETDDFTAASGEMTAKDTTNLRTAPTTNGSQIVYTLKRGEFVTRTGTSVKGWTRLTYNGQTVYAVSSFLLTKEEYEKQISDEQTASGTE